MSRYRRSPARLARDLERAGRTAGRPGDPLCARCALWPRCDDSTLCVSCEARDEEAAGLVQSFTVARAKGATLGEALRAQLNNYAAALVLGDLDRGDQRRIADGLAVLAKVIEIEGGP